MPCRVALLALWASIAAANPLHVEPRQDTTPSSSEAGSAASLAAEVLGDEISLDLSQKEAADDTGLFPGMSCNQLAAAYYAQGSGRRESASDWDALNVSGYFEDWVSSGDRSGNFQVSFALPWGLADTWQDNCDIERCESINCHDMGDMADAPDSAAAYMILVSMARLQDAIGTVHQDLNQAWNKFDRLDDFFETNFAENSPDDADGNTLIREILTGVGTAAVSVAILSENAPATAAAVAFNGALSGINNALNDPIDPDATEIKALLQQSLNSTIQPVLTAVDGMFNELKSEGSYNGVSITEILAEGAFLNSTAIPILNEDLISHDERQEIVLQHVHAAALSWAWRYTRVWAMSYPMSEDDYYAIEWYAGNDDSRLRYYDKDDQRGFFYMSVKPESKRIATDYRPRIQNPPGWGLVSDKLGFDTWTIMKSSWNGYQAGGYDATLDTSGWLEDITTTDPMTAANKSVSQPGVFNVIQCPLDVSDATPDAEAFNELLAGPDAIYDENDDGDEPPFCHCLDVVDKDGVGFEEAIGLRSWVGRYCHSD